MNDDHFNIYISTNFYRNESPLLLPVQYFIMHPHLPRQIRRV